MTKEKVYDLTGKEARDGQWARLVDTGVSESCSEGFVFDTTVRYSGDKYTDPLLRLALHAVAVSGSIAGAATYLPFRWGCWQTLTFAERATSSLWTVREASS